MILITHTHTHTHTHTDSHRHLIKLIKHKENLGVTFARKTGILSAKSEIILFVDGDDLISNKNALGKISKHFSSNPNIDLVRFGYQKIDNNKITSQMPSNEIFFQDYEIRTIQYNMDYYLNNANNISHAVMIGAYAYKKKFVSHQRFLNCLAIDYEDTYGNAVMGSLKPLVLHTKEIFYTYRMNNPQSITALAKNRNETETLMLHNKGFTSFSNFNINNSVDFKNYGTYGYAQHAINFCNGFRNMIKNCKKNNILCPELSEFKEFFKNYRPYAGIRRIFVQLCLMNPFLDSLLTKIYSKKLKI